MIKLGIQVCDTINRSTRAFAARALIQALRWGLDYLSIFPCLCLRRQPTKLVKQACERFCKGDVDALFREAKEAAAATPSEGGSSPSFLMEDDDLSSAAGTAGAIPAATLARAEVLANSGFLSRASSTLNCSALAPPGEETLEKLRALHPQGAPIDASVLARSAQVPFTQLSEAEVRKALFGIGRGSVGGPSRLSRDHLATCLSDPALGGTLLSLVTVRVNELIDLPLASFQRWRFFGARLVALAKKDGGVRPVAVGEISRRILAKAMLARHSEALGKLLLGTGQVGVGIKSGAEALVAASRLFASTVDDSQVLLKVDFKNAFNTVHRRAFFAALERLSAQHPEVAELLRYVRIAYGSESPLFFFDQAGATHILPSSDGCQQGDPLGPVLFAIALAKVMGETTACFDDLQPPPLIGSYLDDMVVGGSSAEVSMFFAIIKDELAGIGLQVNLSKCEVVGSWDPELVDEDLFAGMAPLDLGSWELLGVPCGSVDAFLERRVHQVGLKLAQFGNLPSHLAFLLARSCGAYPMLQYWLRSVGGPGQAHFDKADQLSLGFLSGLVGPIPPSVAPAVFLPSAHGGLGVLRCGGELPKVAHFASLRSSLAVLHGLLPSWPVDLFDDLVGDAGAGLDLPEEIPQKKLQHFLAARLHQSTASAFLADPSVPEESRHRFRMGGGFLRFAAVLAPPADMIAISPLSSEVLFTHFVRFRLGLPLSPSAVPCLSSCGALVGCGGDHALSCMKGGDKQSWHFALLREVSRLCSLALWNPRLEVHPFPEAPSLRMDILLPAGTFDPSRATLIDVSIVNTSCGPASSAPNKAAETAAKAKVAKYGKYVDAHHVFLPLLFETTGGVSSQVPVFLDSLSKAITARLDVDGGRLYARQCVVNSLARSVSTRLVKQFASQSPPPSSPIDSDCGVSSAGSSEDRPEEVLFATPSSTPSLDTGRPSRASVVV